MKRDSKEATKGARRCVVCRVVCRGVVVSLCRLSSFNVEVVLTEAFVSLLAVQPREGEA